MPDFPAIPSADENISPAEASKSPPFLNFILPLSTSDSTSRLSISTKTQLP